MSTRNARPASWPERGVRLRPPERARHHDGSPASRTAPPPTSIDIVILPGCNTSMQEDSDDLGPGSETSVAGTAKPALATAAASLAALVALWIVSVLLWPDLPGNGPTAWRFLLPALATLGTASCAGANMLAGRLARRRPGRLCVPRKKDFLKLPQEARVRVVRHMEPAVWTIAVVVNALFIYFLACGILPVAPGQKPSLHELLVVPGAVIVGLALMVRGLFTVRRAIIAETDRAEGLGKGLRAEEPSPSSS